MSALSCCFYTWQLRPGVKQFVDRLAQAVTQKGVKTRTEHEAVMSGISAFNLVWYLAQSPGPPHCVVLFLDPSVSKDAPLDKIVNDAQRNYPNTRFRIAETVTLTQFTPRKWAVLPRDDIVSLNLRLRQQYPNEYLTLNLQRYPRFDPMQVCVPNVLWACLYRK